MLVIAKIFVDGRIQRAPREKWELSELQTFVGGYIEQVPSILPGLSLICDEEGLLKDKPVNAKASALVRGGIRMDGGLRGDCLLVQLSNL